MVCRPRRWPHRPRAPITGTEDAGGKAKSTGQGAGQGRPENQNKSSLVRLLTTIWIKAAIYFVQRRVLGQPHGPVIHDPVEKPVPMMEVIPSPPKKKKAPMMMTGAIS